MRSRLMNIQRLEKKKLETKQRDARDRANALTRDSVDKATT